MITVHNIKDSCSKCVMPELSGKVYLQNAICSDCLKVSSSVQANEAELEKRLTKIKSKHHYEIVVTTDGGIESLYCLHLMKTKFNLNPLLFTFDHGYLSETEFENIKRVVAKLKIDFVQFKTSSLNNEIKENFNNNKSTSLHQLVWENTLLTALEFSARNDSPYLLFNLSRLTCDKKRLNEILNKKLKNNVAVLNIDDFIQVRMEDAEKVLKQEYNFQDGPVSPLYTLSSLKMTKLRGWSEEQEYFSHLIRLNKMDKKTAVNLLSWKIEKQQVEELINKLGIRAELLGIE